MNKTLFLVIFSILLLNIKIVGQELSAINPLSIDTVENNLTQQLAAYPQEKIYVQTDKGGYLSGERIWFRAHLQDAFSHKPIFISRYIYVELLSPFDNLVERVKVRPDSTGVYSGFLDLHDDLSEGNYTIRAYTQYMRNGGEESFARRSISIYDPFSLEIEPLIRFDVNDNNANVSIKFVDRQTNDTIRPELVSCQLAHKNTKNLRPQSDNSYRWSEKVNDKNRTMLLSLKYKDRKYSRFYTIPVQHSLFDVSFMPEGGYLIPNVVNQVAFKALKEDGWGERVFGTVFNSKNEEVASLNTIRHGMGIFGIMPIKGETYYADITNEYGDSKRFDLPLVNNVARSLTARIIGKRMLIAVNSGDEAVDEELTLLIHHKGQVVYHKALNKSVEAYTFPSEGMPTGILNIMLLNSNRDILSERLVFNLNGSNIPNVDVETSASSYKRRAHVPVSMKLSNGDGQLIQGSVAVSVIDKNSVVQDTSINIKSYLLLSSELKGHIEAPKSYFGGSKEDNIALDVLMLTQGWRRYNIPKVLKGEIDVPSNFEPEMAQKIKGKADGLFTSLKEGNISLMATLDTLVSTVTTLSNEKGQFEFDVEYPAGTSILVQSLSKRGGSNNLINLEKETFPDIHGYSIAAKASLSYDNDVDLDAYLQRANEEYVQQFGIRTIMLEDFTVTAQSKEKYKESSFYSALSATGVRTAEDIEKMKVSSLRSLLYTQPGVVVRSDNVTSTRSDRPILFIIDNVYYEDFAQRLDDIDVSSIESLFVIRDNTTMPGYFPNTDGAIVITTKIGYTPKSSKPINIDHIVPLGYQKYAEFYSPTYELDEQKGMGMPDLRTTIYWKPNVIFDENGEAQINFYTADIPTVYLLIGEGVSDTGEAVRFEHEIEVIN